MNSTTKSLIQNRFGGSERKLSVMYIAVVMWNMQYKQPKSV